MDEKLKGTLDKVVRLAEQNKEFGEELRKRLEVSYATPLSLSDKKIEEIYEYCIEKVNYMQACDLYKDFPITASKDYLLLDYIRMERFWRKNQFGDFCLAMYQQIENITNNICVDSTFQSVVQKMWNEKCYVKTYDALTKKTISPLLEIRDGGVKNTTIAEFLFFGTDKNGNKNSETKPRIALDKQTAYDKMRIVLYFVGYKAELKTRDKQDFDDIIALLYELYQCRNMNHRGSNQNENSEAIIARISNLRSLYYSKFHGLLSQYVEFVKNGYPLSERLIYYAKNLS